MTYQHYQVDDLISVSTVPSTCSLFRHNCDSGKDGGRIFAALAPAPAPCRAGSGGEHRVRSCPRTDCPRVQRQGDSGRQHMEGNTVREIHGRRETISGENATCVTCNTIEVDTGFQMVYAPLSITNNVRTSVLTETNLVSWGLCPLG